MITSYEYTTLEDKEVTKIFNEKIKSREWVKTKEGYSSSVAGEYDYFKDKEEGVFPVVDGNTRNQAKSYFSSLFSIDYTDVKVKREPSLDTYKDLLSGNRVSKYDIKDDYFREGLKKFVDMYKGSYCHIHTDHGFWGYNHSGYTHSRSKAGIYPIEEGYNVLMSCGLDKQGGLYVISREDLEEYIEPKELELEKLKSWREVI